MSESNIAVAEAEDTTGREKLDKVLALLQVTTFQFSFKGRHRVDSVPMLAASLDDAKKITQEYCTKYKLRWIGVSPYFMDMNKQPIDQGRGGIQWQNQT